MEGIPRAALLLGVAGLIPFVVGAALGAQPFNIIGYVSGNAILRLYGLVILGFMAGTLWGFAVSGGRADVKWLGLSVTPAVLIFIAYVVAPGDALISLAIGFPALLLVDLAFAREGLAPPWWMALRTRLTIIVTICLVIGIAS